MLKCASPDQYTLPMYKAIYNSGVGTVAAVAALAATLFRP